METREKKLYRYSRAFKQKVVNDIECGQLSILLPKIVREITSREKRD